MLENITLYLFIIFTISGLVKGVIGMGLPTVSLLLLTLFTDLNTAISLIIIPSLVTNIFQGFFGKHLKELINEFLIFFVGSGVFVYFGTFIFLKINILIPTLLLSLLIIIYSCVILLKINISINNEKSMFLRSLVFSSNGFLTGITGSLLVPGVFYFQALGFKKEKLLQALGLHFSFLSIFLGLSNSQFNNYLAKELLLISFLSCIFAFLGMYVGNYFTKNINEKTFKNLFLYSLIVLGFLLTLKIYIFR